MKIEQVNFCLTVSDFSSQLDRCRLGSYTLSFVFQAFSHMVALTSATERRISP